MWGQRERAGKGGHSHANIILYLIIFKNCMLFIREKRKAPALKNILRSLIILVRDSNVP